MFPAVERRTIVGVGLVVAMRVLGFSLVLAVIAKYAHDLTVAQYGAPVPLLIGLATGAYGFTLAALQLPLGALSDRIGRKPVLLGGVAVFALGSLGASLAPTVELLILARLVEGLGAVSSVAMALIADVVPVERRATAMAFVGIPVAVAMLGGVVVGPFLAGIIGVPGLFALTAALALLAEGVFAILVREPPRHEAGAAGALDVKPVVRDPHLRRVDVAAFVNRFVLMSFFVHVPLVVADSVGLGVDGFWRLLLGMVVLGAIPMVLLGRVADRGHMRAAAGAAAVVLVAGPLLLLVTVPAFGATGLLVGGVVFFAGFSALESLLPAMATNLAPPERRGLSIGVFNTSQFLGSALGAVAGAVLYAHPFAYAGVLVVLGGGAVWALATVREPPARRRVAAALVSDAR